MPPNIPYTPSKSKANYTQQIDTNVRVPKLPSIVCCVFHRFCETSLPVCNATVARTAVSCYLTNASHMKRGEAVHAQHYHLINTLPLRYLVSNSLFTTYYPEIGFLWYCFPQYPRVWWPSTRYSSEFAAEVIFSNRPPAGRASTKCLL